MRSKALVVASLLFAFWFITGMGEKGSGFSRAPRVDKNFVVTVIDASGKRIEGDRFSWEGRLRFSGYLGMAQVNIPFENVRELTVTEKKERSVLVTVKLREGGETNITMDAESRCYGEAGFGSFMLRMDEVRTVTLK